MGSFTRDCPHEGCRARNTGFTGVAEGPADGHYLLTAVCNTCRGPVLVRLKPTGKSGISPMNCDHISMANNFSVTDIWPQSPRVRMVDHLPGNVASAFIEAEHNRADHRYPSAGMAYRRAIERALKHLAPEGKGMLNARIRQIEAQNALPRGLIELLDAVKLLGNDAAHEDEDPEPDDVARAAEFARLFFTYTFDLPAQVAAAKARRNGGAA